MSELFYCSYDSNINADRSAGSPTGTATGGAAVSGGELDLAHADVRYVSYNGVSNAEIAQLGTVRFKVTPNYSGTPSENYPFLSLYDSPSTGVNFIGFAHLSTGNILLEIYNSSGNILLQELFGAWSPTASQKYSFQLNIDVTTGNTLLYIDGVQFGTTATQTGTRSTAINYLKVGQYHPLLGTFKTNYLIDDFQIFNSVEPLPPVPPVATKDFSNNIKGSTASSVQIEKGGPNLINNSGVIEVKNASGSVFVDFNALSLISGDASQAGSIVVYGDANKVTFIYASGQSADSTYTWPKPDSGKFLKTDASGNLLWDTTSSPPTDIYRVFSKEFAFDTSSPFNYFPVMGITAIISEIQVIIDTPFDDATSTLKIGVSGDLERFMKASENNLAGSTGNIYEVKYDKNAILDDVICTLDPASSSQGTGKILMYGFIPETL